MYYSAGECLEVLLISSFLNFLVLFFGFIGCAVLGSFGFIAQIPFIICSLLVVVGIITDIK